MDNFATFNTAPYPAYTSRELESFVAEGHANAAAMVAEISRRLRVKGGDRSLMTPAECLRAERGAL
jgi:hypothetical protein